MKATTLLAPLALMVVFGVSHSALGQYSFNRIADTSGDFNSFGASSINSSGTVVFYAELDGGGGIFTGSGGPVTTIADGTGIFRPNDFNRFPDINNAGTVAFEGVLDAGGAQIDLRNPTKTIVSTAGEFLLLGSPSLNNNNEVAFRGFLDLNTEEGVFRSDGTTHTPIVTEAGVFNAFGSFVALNDSGTVAFQASLDAGGSGIYTGSGGPTSTIADTTGVYSSFLEGSLRMNNAGAVAFTADLDAGGTGIYVVDGGGTTTITDTSGPYAFLGAPLLSESGDVVFGALLDTGGLGIFSGPNPATDLIIGTGSSLDGSTVTNLNYFQGLNDDGSFAFYAELADGRRGIYIAVPEPSGLVLLSAGLLALLRRRRARSIAT